MREKLLNILKEYLLIFPEEEKRQSEILDYLQKHTDEEITDWNNFDGHLVAGGFIYAKFENEFLVLYHNDLGMYLYPGGHINHDDKDPLYAAKREIKEETGLDGLKQLKLSENKLIPIDIDTHIINYNKRLNLPEHYHFQFRYLFTINKKEEVKIDSEELLNYKWIGFEELGNDPNYGKIISKILEILPKYKVEKLQIIFSTAPECIETKELNISDELKRKIEMICRFAYAAYSLENGNIKSIKDTNIAYIKPHILKVNNNHYLIFEECDDVFINGYKDKIKFKDLENYLKQD